MKLKSLTIMIEIRENSPAIRAVDPGAAYISHHRENVLLANVRISEPTSLEILSQVAHILETAYEPRPTASAA